ncbi:hypothetical protein BC828DRAFT_373270 [Blastocladiella britannica]|nr:hypothetical protein BC828DRAFT_373270 [Blastocladiella britannica]
MAAVHPHDTTFSVPVEGDEVVELTLDPLPPAHDVIEALHGQTDPKHIARLAVLYHQRAHAEEAASLADAADSPDAAVHAQSYETRAPIKCIRVALALATSPPSARLLASAADDLAFAEKIDPNYVGLWITRAAVALAAGDLDAADRQLASAARHVSKRHLPATACLAHLAERRGDWRAAQLHWQRALRLVSGNPRFGIAVQVDVRLHLGVAFARLGHVAPAQAAWRRVMEIDSENVAARAYLASLYINEARRPEKPRGSDIRTLGTLAQTLLQEAYTLMRKQGLALPLVHARLADMMFIQGDDHDARKLLESVLDAADALPDPAVGAEVRMYLARIDHREGNLDRAAAGYAAAIARDPANRAILPARFQLAQIHVARGDLSSATPLLEQVRDRASGSSGSGDPDHDLAGGSGGVRGPAGAGVSGGAAALSAGAAGAGAGTSLGDDYDALKQLALVHARLAETPHATSATMPTKEYQETRERARALYSRALELFKLLYDFSSGDSEMKGTNDPEVLLVHARMLESAPFADAAARESALNCYRRVEAIFLKRNQAESVPPEIHNNIGVLLHYRGDFNDAEIAYKAAMNSVRSNPSADASAIEVTLQYNFSRALEASGSVDQAAVAYRRLLKRNPQYIDAHLRLASIESSQSRLDEAARHAASALDAVPDSVDAHVLLATILRSQGEYLRARGDSKRSQAEFARARMLFSKVLRSIDKFDLVSLLQLGNMYLFDTKIAFPEGTTKVTKEMYTEARGRHLLEAYKLFDKVLQLDPRNPYAANGLGIAFREKGHREEALRVFEQVREADPTVPCFAINYAHMLGEMGDHKRVVPLYETAQQKFFSGTSLELHLAAARASFLHGKATKLVEYHRAALNHIQRAIRQQPSNPDLQFDLVVVLQDLVYAVSHERSDYQRVEALQHDAERVALALRIIETLSTRHADRFDANILEQRARFITETKDKVEKRIASMLQAEKDREHRRQLMLEEQERKKQEELAHTSAANDQRRVELQRQLDEFAASRAAIDDRIKMVSELAAREQTRRAASGGRRGGGGGGRGNRSISTSDTFIAGEDEESDEAEMSDGSDGRASSSASSSSRSKSKSKKSKRASSSAAGGDDADDPEAKQRRQREALKNMRAKKRGARSASNGDDEGDDDDHADGEEHETKRRRLSRKGDRVKTKDVIEDSDEELADE